MDIRSIISKFTHLLIRRRTSDNDSNNESNKLDEAAEIILNSKNIVVMAGAGLSTAAGIPDFRSPTVGIYAAYKTNKLRNPEDLFSYHQFIKDPKPFYDAVQVLFPESLVPTIAHYFIRMLHDKGKLLRFFTQNVDGLEQLSGIPKEKIVEAHGTFASSHCINCNKSYSFDWLYDHIQRKVIPICENCRKTVKPDVVLFGENLPERFNQCVHEDMPKADCVIILGTSLKVYPFCYAHFSAPSSCPKIIINQTSLLQRMFRIGWSSSNTEKEYFEFKESCDQGCSNIAEKLNWKKDLDKLVKSEHERLSKFESLAIMVDHEQRNAN